MRLFVAVDIGAEVAAAAEGLTDTLRKRAARLAPQARITWIPANRMHVTVRFIGHVDAPVVSRIEAALAAPIDVPAFDVVFSGAGTFPPSGAPRVIWAGVAGGGVMLGAVEKEISRRLADIDLPHEDRPYRPHLTLARVREAAGLRSAALLDGLRETALGTTRVEAITLYESRPSPKGPAYLPVRQIALWKRF